MHPDIIIAADFFKQEMIQSLRDLGLKVYVYKTPNNMEEIKKAKEYIKKVYKETYKEEPYWTE